MKKETPRQKKVADLIHLFLHTNRLHRSLMEEQIRKLGIHASQHHMLMIIANNKGICQKDIAKKLEISSAAVAVTLNKLEAADLISRTQSFDDARVNHITITDKGSSLLKTTKQIFDGIDEQLFRNVEDEELDQMIATLKKVAENAEK